MTPAPITTARTDEPRTNPGNTPQAETLLALRYMLSGDYRDERHDDGTVTVWGRGGAITVLSDGTLTGYDDTAPGFGIEEA